MTKIEVWLVEETTKRICVKGHSGYDVSGKDIVCSAISTAVMLAVNIIDEVCSDYIFNTDGNNAEIILEIKDLNNTANIVMKNLYLTLEEISRQYPKFVKVRVNK